MRTTGIILILIGVLISCITCSPRFNHTDPSHVSYVTEDLDRFQQVFHLLDGRNNEEILKKGYFEPGTRGVKTFKRKKIHSASSLSEAINAYPEYYRNLDSLKEKIVSQKLEILNGMRRLQIIYPEARFPDIYFLIGSLNCGGTVTDDAIIIGAEFFAKNENTNMGELSGWHQEIISTAEDLPALVIHELVHIQQDVKPKDLLSTAIMEGSADFITELVMGRHPNSKIHSFANEREYFLWREFQTKMYSKDFRGWLYGDATDRPPDLGYWMGYKITQSYYENQQDKSLAIKTILNINDFHQFLKQSGYEGIP